MVIKFIFIQFHLQVPTQAVLHSPFGWPVSLPSLVHHIATDVAPVLPLGSPLYEFLPSYSPQIGCVHELACKSNSHEQH